MQARASFRLVALMFGALMSVAIATSPTRASNVQEITTPSGITLWLVEDYTLPMLVMNTAFRGGSTQDPEGRAGLANMLAGLLDEGAGDLDSRAFQARLEDLSISLNFEATPDAFYGNLRTLTTNCDEAFELFRLAITEPRLDDEPLERIRGQVLTNLRRAESDPNNMAGRLWAATLFGDHPYGRGNDGTVDSVAAITRDDLEAFHRRTIARDDLNIVIVGAIDAETAAALVDRTFGTLPEHADLTPISDVTAAAGESEHAALSVPQTTIRLGGPGLTRDDPDFIAAYVANQILGGGTFSSRLYKAIREERGLAYSVGSGLIPFVHGGAFMAATSVDAANADMAVQIILDEISRFVEEGPTEEELAAAKDYLVGNFALRFDSAQKIARNLLHFQLDDLGVDYIGQRNALIRSVTLEDVQRAAERIWGEGASIITVGPAQS